MFDCNVMAKVRKKNVSTQHKALISCKHFVDFIHSCTVRLKSDGTQ